MIIVVGVRRRPESWAALDWAITEAAAHDAEVVAVTSLKGPEDDTEHWDADVDRDEATRRLEESGIPHRVRGLARGKDAAEDLVDVADEVDADMIVIGARKRSRVGKLLLGSVALDVLQLSRVPVVLVKDHEHDG